MKNFKKPDLNLYFAGLPAVGIWMSSEYDNAKDLTQCVNTMHNWFNIAEETHNIVKKQCYETGASLLYKLLIGKSYESKTLIL